MVVNDLDFGLLVALAEIGSRFAAMINPVQIVATAIWLLFMIELSPN